MCAGQGDRPASGANDRRGKNRLESKSRTTRAITRSSRKASAGPVRVYAGSFLAAGSWTGDSPPVSVLTLELGRVGVGRVEGVGGAWDVLAGTLGSQWCLVGHGRRSQGRSPSVSEFRHSDGTLERPLRVEGGLRVEHGSVRDVRSPAKEGGRRVGFQRRGSIGTGRPEVLSRGRGGRHGRVGTGWRWGTRALSEGVEVPLLLLLPGGQVRGMCRRQCVLQHVLPPLKAGVDVYPLVPLPDRSRASGLGDSTVGGRGTDQDRGASVPLRDEISTTVNI